MELREKCIRQTLNLLAEQGLKFTMADLSKSLGISKKTLYKEFDSKEELLLAVADSGFAAVKKSEEEVLADTSLSLQEKVAKLIIVLPGEYQNLNWYLMEEVAEKYPKVYTYIKERLESDWEPTIFLLEKGVKEGVFRSFSIPVFRGMVEGSMEHFLTSPDLQKEDISYEEALKSMITILLEGIRVK